MPTVEQNIKLIRQRLGEPSPQKPTDPQILNILIEKISDHCAQLQNTRNHWSVDRTTLSVSAGTEDYQISAQNFGRPFLVYSVDSSDPYHCRREIPFSLLQDAEQRYLGPQQTQSASKHSAVEICFYRTSPAAPTWQARLVPIPGESGDYEIWYEANYEFGALGDSPGLSPFHHLIRVETALSVLPLCAWAKISIDKNPEKWAIQMNALRDGLLLDREMYQKRFDSYKAQASREGVSQKRGVGWEYEEEWGYRGGRMINGWGV